MPRLRVSNAVNGATVALEVTCVEQLFLRNNYLKWRGDANERLSASADIGLELGVQGKEERYIVKCIFKPATGKIELLDLGNQASGGQSHLLLQQMAAKATVTSSDGSLLDEWHVSVQMGDPADEAIDAHAPPAAVAAPVGAGDSGDSGNDSPVQDAAALKRASPQSSSTTDAPHSDGDNNGADNDGSVSEGGGSDGAGRDDGCASRPRPGASKRQRRSPETPSSKPLPAKVDGDERLNLEAVTQDGDKLRLRCRRTTLVGDIWRHVAKKIGSSSDQFRVLYDGELIQHYAAIGLYGVKDGDRLDVVFHRVAC